MPLCAPPSCGRWTRFAPPSHEASGAPSTTRPQDLLLCMETAKSKRHGPRRHCRGAQKCDRSRSLPRPHAAHQQRQERMRPSSEPESLAPSAAPATLAGPSPLQPPLPGSSCASVAGAGAHGVAPMRRWRMCVLQVAKIFGRHHAPMHRHPRFLLTADAAQPSRP